MKAPLRGSTAPCPLRTRGRWCNSHDKGAQKISTRPSEATRTQQQPETNLPTASSQGRKAPFLARGLISITSTSPADTPSTCTPIKRKPDVVQVQQLATYVPFCFGERTWQTPARPCVRQPLRTRRRHRRDTVTPAPDQRTLHSTTAGTLSVNASLPDLPLDSTETYSTPTDTCSRKNDATLPPSLTQTKQNKTKTNQAHLYSLRWLLRSHVVLWPSGGSPGSELAEVHAPSRPSSSATDLARRYHDRGHPRTVASLAPRGARAVVHYVTS